MPGNPTADHQKRAVLLPWKTTKAAYTFSQGAAENALEINDRKRNWFQNSVTSTVFLPSIAPQNVTTALQLGMDVEGTVCSDNSEWTSKEQAQSPRQEVNASQDDNLGPQRRQVKNTITNARRLGQRVCPPRAGLWNLAKCKTPSGPSIQPWRTNFDLWKAAAIIAGSKVGRYATSRISALFILRLYLSLEQQFHSGAPAQRLDVVHTEELFRITHFFLADDRKRKEEDIPTRTGLAVAAPRMTG
ncbi:hypothetical protein CPB85DRAFT_1249702 [Mucidula mucida]|nr:hypothetical protein CPB85DRAFT_1261644 [Mucidula mucida]KAF8918035.1 hypothetical protein CPB85DRAFT_1249702 [Mucidula mucida]